MTSRWNVNLVTSNDKSTYSREDDRSLMQSLFHRAEFKAPNYQLVNHKTIFPQFFGTIDHDQIFPADHFAHAQFPMNFNALSLPTFQKGMMTAGSNCLNPNSCQSQAMPYLGQSDSFNNYRSIPQNNLMFFFHNDEDLGQTGHSVSCFPSSQEVVKEICGNDQKLSNMRDTSCIKYLTKEKNKGENSEKKDQQKGPSLFKCKKFICDFPKCGKRFSMKYNLKIHYRYHSGEKPYKCNFANCPKAFYDKGNLKYHIKTGHNSEEIIHYPYKCQHNGCTIQFKTKKQKLIHHDKMEKECKNERNALVKLLRKYKSVVNKLICSYSIDISQLPLGNDLKVEYSELEKKLMDPDYFHCMLGSSFEENCERLDKHVQAEEE